MATRRKRGASKSKQTQTDMQKLEALLKGLGDSGLADDLRGFVSERKQGAGGLSAAAQQGGLGVGTEAPTSQFDKPSKWSLQDRGPEAIRGRETIRDSTNEAFRRGLGEQAREETGIEAPPSKSKLDRLKGLAGRAAGWLGSGRGGIQGRDVQRQQPAPEAVKPRVGLMQPTSQLTQRPAASPTAPDAPSGPGYWESGWKSPARGGPTGVRTGPQQGAAGADPSRPDEPVAAPPATTTAQRKKLTDSARFSSQMPAYGGALRGSTPPAATPPPATATPPPAPRETRGWESGLTPPAAAPAARAKRGGEVTQRPQSVDPRQGKDYQSPTQAAPQPPLTRDRTRLPAATGGVGKPLPRDTRGGPNMMTPTGPISGEERARSKAMGFGDFQKAGGTLGGGYSPAATGLQAKMEAGSVRAGKGAETPLAAGELGEAESRRIQGLIKLAKTGSKKAMDELNEFFANQEQPERTESARDRVSKRERLDVGGTGRVGGQRVPSGMQGRNLADLRAQYNAIRNAPSARGSRRAR